MSALKMEVSATEINKHLKVFEVFSHLGAEMPVGQIIFFLNAVKNQGSILKDIGNVSGAKVSTASRYLGNLSEKNEFNLKGLGLLKATENPANRKEKLIFLTEDGKKLVKALIGKPSKE